MTGNPGGKGERRWLTRTAKPVGGSAALSCAKRLGARKFRFGPETAVVLRFEELCHAPKNEESWMTQLTKCRLQVNR